MSVAVENRSNDGGITEPRRGRTREWVKASIVGMGVALAACVMVMAFLWPMTTAAPHNIDIAVSAPEKMRDGMADMLQSGEQDMFTVTSVDTREDAVAAIEEAEVSGAVVVTPAGVEVLTASAGGPQTAQLFSQMAQGIQEKMAQTGQKVTVTVTDIVPGGTAAGMANLTLIPALIGGLAGSIVGFLLVKRPLQRAATLVAAALTAGLAGAAILGPWFDILPGSYVLNAAALAAGTLAIGFFITGMGALCGKGGLGLGALTIVLFANPWGGFMVPSEFLVSPWGTLGSYMPNSALIHLLRWTNFFPNAATGDYWFILLAWALLGAAMLWIGAAVHRKKELQLAA